MASLEAPALFRTLEEQYNLPVGTLDAFWAAETSRGQGKMVSRAGAQGHFQQLPDNLKKYGVTRPNDLTDSARGGAAQIADLYTKHRHNIEQAAAAYNGGSWGLIRAGNDPAKMSRETRLYAPKVAAQQLANERAHFDAIRKSYPSRGESYGPAVTETQPVRPALAALSQAVQKGYSALEKAAPELMASLPTPGLKAAASAIPLAGELLGIPGTLRAAEKAAYGERLTKGSGQTLQIPSDTLDLAFNAAPLAGAAFKAGKAVVNAAATAPAAGGQAAQRGAIRLGGSPLPVLTHSTRSPEKILQAGWLDAPSLGITLPHEEGFTGHAAQFVFAPGNRLDPAVNSRAVLLNRDGWFANPVGRKFTGDLTEKPRWGHKSFKNEFEGSFFLHPFSNAADLRLGQGLPFPATKSMAIQASPAFDSFKAFEQDPRGMSLLTHSSSERRKTWEDTAKAFIQDMRSAGGPDFGLQNEKDLLNYLSQYRFGEDNFRGADVFAKYMDKLQFAPSRMAELKVYDRVNLLPGQQFLWAEHGGRQGKASESLLSAASARGVPVLGTKEIGNFLGIPPTRSDVWKNLHRLVPPSGKPLWAEVPALNKISPAIPAARKLLSRSQSISPDLANQLHDIAPTLEQKANILQHPVEKVSSALGYTFSPAQLRAQKLSKMAQILEENADEILDLVENWVGAVTQKMNPDTAKTLADDALELAWNDFYLNKAALKAPNWHDNLENALDKMYDKVWTVKHGFK